MVAPKIEELEDGRIVADNAARLDRTGKALHRCRENARAAVIATWKTAFGEQMPSEVLDELEEALGVAQQKDAHALLGPENQDKRGANHIAELRGKWTAAFDTEKNSEAKRRFLESISGAKDCTAISLEALMVLLHGKQ